MENIVSALFCGQYEVIIQKVGYSNKFQNSLNIGIESDEMRDEYNFWIINK